MVSSYRSGPLLVLLSLLYLSSLASAASIDMTYCASILTASTSANSSDFQSDGLCYNFCGSSYAFAIVQEKNCWCSDYAPDSGDRVDTSECSTQCPGYPDDTCGGAGLYGYMQLAKAAAGTKGGDSTAASTATQAVTKTIQNTVTVDPTTTTTSPTTIASKTSTTSESTGGTTAPATTDGATTTQQPTTFISTITQGGSVIQQTVTVMPTGAGGSQSSSSSSDVSAGHKGLSTGAAVGIAVGVLGFAVIIIAAGFFFWLRRKKRNQEQGSMLEHQNSFRGSSAGMMSTPRTEMASVWEGEAQSVGRRSSRLMPHDPRMDPYATNIYGRFDNKSHESINTLRDDQDYSRRVLRTTNPDPSGE